MKDMRSASIASVLALALAFAAVPAAAQSSSSGTTATQGAGSTTGKLPDSSLAGQRQGAIGGGSVSQGEQGGTAGSSAGTSTGTSTGSGAGSSVAPSGALPDNSLAGQRQGAIGGGSVSQGGSGSSNGSAEKPKQGSGQ